MTSRRYPAKAFAVFAVLLLTLSVLPMIGVFAPEAEGYDGESYNVVYHPGNPGYINSNYNDTTTPGNLEIKYFGTPISEYNPQFWTDASGYRGYINGEIQNGTLTNWYGIKQYHENWTVVFSGWFVSDSAGNITGTETVDPGEDLSDFVVQSDGKIHLTAQWSYITNIDYNSSQSYTSGNKYTNIILLSQDVNLDDRSSNVTIRSDTTNGGSIRTIYLDGSLYMGSSVILDNARLWGNGGTTTQDSNGLYASPNSKLIVGTNVSTTYWNGSYVQIVGGPSSGWYWDNYSYTDVRVFSGTYSNIVGGGTDGYSGTITTTSIVMAGTTSVLEAVWGASIRGETGTSNVLIVNGSINALGYNENGELRQGFSTIIGGSRYGNAGNTEVTITGLSEVFAAQGGGRDPQSYTTNSHVVVSGKAIVEHMVCGSLTDGNSRDANPRVGESTVEVKDSAQVRDVYGGGWDLWADPINPSTGKTNVVISGGHIIGSVYGGGFRGSIGTGIQSDITSSVIVTGGTIDGSVYGGGQGGPDPMSNGNSTNTTGKAYVDGNVSVQVLGGFIKGSVYGGGFGAQKLWGDTNGVNDTAKVTGDVNLTIGGTAVIGGSVYGGGKGLGRGEAINNNDVQNIAYVLGSVTMTIQSGTISGSVFGGGEYGSIGTESSNPYGNITMYIGRASIDGDVFAGGLGEDGRLSAYTLNRFLTIDGATIDGSVYGGSRLGDDNRSGSGNLSHSSHTEIRIVSVDMSGSGNVYGGGYMGHSYMDTYVLIGIPAAEAAGLSNVSGYIYLDSVYGGSSIAEPTGNQSGTTLLDGSSYIHIGSRYQDGNTPYQGVWISGDVFGAGDYCDITGHSEIVFERFSQDISMLSVQKADLVTLIGSSLELDGNVDGASLSGSEKFSFNRVGELVLRYDDQTSTPSRVVANAAASISGYSSQYADGSTGTVPSSYDKYNSIRMNGGMMFSILGQGDTGLDVSIIEGHTVLESDDNPYYGAFAIGTANKAGVPVVVEDDTAFYVKTGGGYVRTQTVDYNYTVSDSNMVFRVWYISGSYKVEDTVTLQDLGNGKTVPGASDIKMPKLVTGSSIVFAGYYVNSDTVGSLNLVDSLDNTSSGRDFLVNVGVSGDGNYTTFNDGKGFRLGSSDRTETSQSGLRLQTTISTNGGFSTTGYVGTITLHFAELSGGIAVNVYDVEISVYLRAQDLKNLTITHDIIMRGSGTVSGSTDIYLPALSNSRTGEYYIKSVTIGGDITITPVATNLNKDGWLYKATNGETYFETDAGLNDYMGIGGVYSPVLRMNYTLQENSDGSMTGATIFVQMREEGTSDFTHTYTIVLNPVKVTQVTITFQDTYLLADSNKPWADYEALFSIDIDYGLTLSETFVAVNTGTLGALSGDAGFIQGFDDALFKSNGAVVAGTESYLDTIVNQVGYTIVPIPDLLAMVAKYKPSTAYENSDGDKLSFEYSVHQPRWYQNALCMAEINFDSKFTSDLSIFAGYSIVVTVMGVIDGQDPFELDVIFPGAPGEAVVLSVDVFTLPIGYEGKGWYTGYDSSTGNFTGKVEDGKLTTFSNTTVYLKLELKHYTLSVLFHKDGNVVTIHYDAPYTFTYRQTVAISGIAVPENYHIASAKGTVQGGGSWTITITNQNSLTFSGPAGDLTVDVYLSNQYTITITMPSGNYSDNSLYSFGQPHENGGAWYIPIVQSSSNRQSSIQITVSSGMYLIVNDIDNYNNNDVFFSIYSSGEEIRKYIGETYYLYVGTIDSDREYEIFVSVQWSVSLGANYTAHYSAYNPDGSMSNDSGVLINGDKVFTGYSITLNPSENYIFGPTFTTHGVVLTNDDPRTYRVISNSGTVVFGDAILRQFTLTVTVLFSDPYPPTPNGTFTLQDSTTTYPGTPTYQNGILTVEYVLASGAYTWAADFDGFVESRGSTSVNGDTSIQVVLQPVTFVIEFYDSDGASIYTFSEYWDEIIGKGISSIYSDSSDAWGVYSSMWDDVVRVIETQDALGYDDFGGNDSDTKTLYLREIPGLSDIVPGNLDIVIFTHQGGINGVHETGVKTGLESDIQYRVDVGGSTVLITVYADGRVLIDNCPEGTGTIVLDLGRGSSLMIVSLPNLDDAGVSQ